MLEDLLGEAEAAVADNRSRRGEKCHPGRVKRTRTIFGPVQLRRRYFYDAARQKGRAPLDEALGFGDGAAWIWELCRVNFPGAVQILDLYHALEHLHQLCQSLYPGQKQWAQKMESTWESQLKNDQVAEVIAAARRRLQQFNPPADSPLESQIAYFEHHQDRMRYKTCRQAGLFCGSGVVEAGCRAVIGQRLKNSGMFRTEAGGKSVSDLRCALQSNRWDECWNRLHESERLKIRAVA